MIFTLVKKFLSVITFFALMITAYSGEKSAPVWKNLFPGMKTIAIIAPGLPGVTAQVDLAIKQLREAGYLVKVMPNARLNEHNRKSVAWQKRLSDFNQAYFDPEVDAIWCVRGGGGSIQVATRLNWEKMRSRKLPVIGFSNITDIHNYMQKQRVGHVFSGPSLTQLTACEQDSVRWFSAVIGKKKLPAIKLKVVRGKACSGYPAGGYSTMYRHGYCGKYVPDNSGKIVFLESNSRKRILADLEILRKQGAFERCAAVVFGHLYAHDQADAEKIIRDFAAKVSCPVYFGFTYGHRSNNFLIDFERCVSITADGVMTFADHSSR